jgi:hypothetical protein
VVVGAWRYLEGGVELDLVDRKSRGGQP